MKIATSCVLLASVISGVPMVHAVIVPLQTIQFTEESFDRGNFSQMTSITARKQAEALLSASIAFIAKVTDLDDAQKNKLQLAGEIDIQRFFSEYDAVKRGLQFGSISRDVWQEQFTRARIEVQPLLTRFSSGLHGDGSLFGKTLQTCLDPEQLNSVEVQRDARKRAIYARNVTLALATIDRTVPLTRKQREKVTEILVTETEPPDVYEISSRLVFQIVGRMDQVKSQLEPLFSETEWKVVNLMIEVGKVNSK